MSFLHRIILLAGLLLVGHNLCSANESPYTINVRGTVISLPKDQALRFMAGHHLESETPKAYLDLLAMVENKQAASAANPAITVKSGQRAFNETGTTRLEVEPILAPTLNMVDTTLLFDFGLTKIGTSFTAKSGEPKFLGAFDDPDAVAATTYLVFIQVDVARGD